MQDALRSVGKRIKNLREHAGLSQEKLAEKCGIHANTLGKIERGQVEFGLLKLFLIANCLGTTASVLLKNIDPFAEPR